MRRAAWIGLLVLVVCAVLVPAANACSPICSCSASYNGGICTAECGPCPSGMCAKCTCSSETGCVFGCFPKAGGGGGGGSNCDFRSGGCPIFMDAQALTLTGLIEFIRPHFAPGWTVAVVGEDDGTRATFGGEWTLEDVLRIHYGRRVERDEGRRTVKITR